jgi:hypothetical protein
VAHRASLRTWRENPPGPERRLPGIQIRVLAREEWAARVRGPAPPNVREAPVRQVGNARPDEARPKRPAANPPRPAARPRNGQPRGDRPRNGLPPSGLRRNGLPRRGRPPGVRAPVGQLAARRPQVRVRERRRAAGGSIQPRSAGPAARPAFAVVARHRSPSARRQPCSSMERRSLNRTPGGGC